MISELNEIEAKLDAGFATPAGFKEYMMDRYQIEEFRHVHSPDYYWKLGEEVVRHRVNHTGRHELTVKKRKSTDSTRDRVEIDLHFTERTEPKHVEAFLKAIGYKPVFTLHKESHIFQVELTEWLDVEFVMYDVQIQGLPSTKKRFIEIEAKKGSPVTVQTAKRHVSKCVADMREHFELGEPLNESLYEIYSKLAT